MSNKLIKTTLPLSPIDMVEFFKDKDKTFIIDYEASKESMSPKSILIYLSNLQITCDFDYIDSELVKEYINLRDLCNIDELDLFVANLVYFSKYQIPFIDTQSFADFGKQALEENGDAISFYASVMEASPLFILSKNFEDLIEDSVKSDVPSKIGFCFLNLYKIPDFLLSFLETMAPLSEQKYFPEIFNNDNYIFKGCNLFEYFSNENNLFYSYLINLTRFKEFDAGDDSPESMNSANIMVDIYTTLHD